MEDSKTPLLDELEKGPWPSFVTQMKRAAEKKPAAKDALGQLELSYRDKIVHWKHGGIVGVRGYGGGVIGRYSDVPEQFPEVRDFHTLRVNQPSGWFYTSEALRKLCDIWEEFGSGLTNFHGATGDVILLGTTTPHLQPCFDTLSQAGFDLGGSGSALRTPSCCVGPGRCEFANIDTLDLTNDLTHTFQNELHRPMWPYKYKIKVSGCANDCVAAIARSDMPVIGTWRDTMRIDQDAVRDYVNNGFDIQSLVVEKCPTNALAWDAKNKELKLDGEECVRCMHCINMMPKALRPGVEKGATILIGGKAPIVKGAYLSWVLVPFMKMEPPYTEFKELLYKIWDWWDENAKVRERVGELIDRMGMRTFLKAVDLPPIPQMVMAPRSNPYYFWDADEVK
ncbi:MAG: dissimilatory-type sulfite reductase subunit alpha [Dehalococcoidales bacterium]|nr:dissimilatory-type sulfite reductase subunit alpha [Dehalococcoidales bacterium]